MKKLLKIVLVNSLTLLCFSCYYNEFPEDVIDIDPEEDVSFANDITPIFVSYNCSQCHNAALDPDLRAGNEYNSLVPDYVVAFDADASRLYNKLNGGHRDVDATSLAYIEAWINQGAEDN